MFLYIVFHNTYLHAFYFTNSFKKRFKERLESIFSAWNSVLFFNLEHFFNHLSLHYIKISDFPFLETSYVLTFLLIEDFNICFFVPLISSSVLVCSSILLVSFPRFTFTNPYLFLNRVNMKISSYLLRLDIL